MNATPHPEHSDHHEHPNQPHGHSHPETGRHAGHSHQHGHAHPEPGVHTTGSDAEDAPAFDRAFWEAHWNTASASEASPRSAHAKALSSAPANPYVVEVAEALPRGSALDAGCGTGAEARALAERGWDVTGVDLSAAALQAAAATPSAVAWQRADLTRWEPGRTWDLVVTNYAHATIGQMELYRRIAAWVAPGGTLQIVGHTGHDHPDEATVTLADIVDLFDPEAWAIDAAAEHTRSVASSDGTERVLHDAVVRARRLR